MSYIAKTLVSQNIKRFLIPKKDFTNASPIKYYLSFSEFCLRNHKNKLIKSLSNKTFLVTLAQLNVAIRISIDWIRENAKSNRYLNISNFVLHKTCKFFWLLGYLVFQRKSNLNSRKIQSSTVGFTRDRDQKLKHCATTNRYSMYIFVMNDNVKCNKTWQTKKTSTTNLSCKQDSIQARWDA